MTSEKEFYNQKEFADLLTLSKMAISKAINPKNGKPARLQYWKETKQIYINDPLTQAFIKNVTPERLRASTAVTKPKTNGESNGEYASVTITKAIEEKAIEEALLKRGQRQKVDLFNAQKRGELLAMKAIEESVMMFLDRMLNTNKRYFSASYDTIVRETLAAESKVPGLKQKFLNEMEQAADEAKNTVCDKLNEISIDQGKR